MATAQPPASIVIYDHERPYTDSLDLEYVDGVAADVAATLQNEHVAEVAYQPGDGSFYGFAFVPLRTVVAARPRVKDGSEWERHAARGMLRDGSYRDDAYLLAWVEHGCYPVRFGDVASFSVDYLAEHFGCSRVSALSLALLLRAVDHHLRDPA